MRRMSKEEYRAFLLGQARTAKLATVRQDGRPHVVPVWFDLDDDCLIFTTDENAVKTANMRREGRVALCIDNETPPFDYVSVEGTVTMSDDPDDLLHWATRIGGRYMGEARAEEFGRRNGVPGELLVRVTPVKVIAYAGLAE